MIKSFLYQRVSELPLDINDLPYLDMYELYLQEIISKNLWNLKFSPLYRFMFSESCEMEEIGLGQRECVLKIKMECKIK